MAGNYGSTTQNIGSYSYTNQAPRDPKATWATLQQYKNNSQVQTPNPYAAYQNSNRNVGWPSGQSAQQLQQGDWQRNYGVLQQMGVNDKTAGVFAGAPSQAVPLLGLQQSATQDTQNANRERINSALQSLQQAQNNVGGTLGPQITQNYQQLLQQGSALSPAIRNQMMESQVNPQVNAAYNAQVQMANSMSGPARDAAMQRAQEVRQNRVLEGQRELSIRDAQESFMQRLLANQQAGQYESGLAEAQRPYVTQGALLNATAAQEEAPDYSGLLNLIMGGQNMQNYQPSGNMVNYASSGAGGSNFGNIAGGGNGGGNNFGNLMALFGL